MDEKDTNEATDDIEYEDTSEKNVDTPELEDVEEDSIQKIKSLRAKLKDCEATKASHLEELQRVKADFLNSKKRLEDKSILDRERILNTFIESLLPLCDSFDMAFADSKAWEDIDESWQKGIEGIYSQLNQVLKKHNVEVIDAANEEFNPERHEALSAIDGEEESDTIVEVVQKGYERNGVVIRPAKVIIQN